MIFIQDSTQIQVWVLKALNSENIKHSLKNLFENWKETNTKFQSQSKDRIQSLMVSLKADSETTKCLEIWWSFWL